MSFKKLILIPLLASLLAGCSSVDNGSTLSPAVSHDETQQTTDDDTKPSSDNDEKPTSGDNTDPQPVTPSGQDKYTIMIYLCGADLESSSGYLCSKSISNILSVSGQPDDVNIIIETGGAKKWSSTYSISNKNLQRYHVENKKLVLDETLSATNNMGLSSTFESFIEWGLTSYPAEKTGVILSNHGGAMWGVCFDENNPLKNLSYDWNDGLTNDEVDLALSNAFKKCNRTSKLEWIGYDACLMQVQDIAEFNSKYFNYMIASEESEVGEGWNYSNWIDDLYAKKDTTIILKEICDTYISYCNKQGERDCTLSYLNLNKMDSYHSSFETLANSLKSKVTSSNKNSFISLIKSAKKYGGSESNYYGIYDAKDFLNKLNNNSTFNPGGTLVSDAISAISDLIAYNKTGSSAGNSNGLCLFFSTNSDTEQSTYYNASMTNFTNWRYLSNSYGY